tara:strand:+ start:1188 stop:3029 length:1842 start_codon:yes stop_codon:yes gene_type:complete
MAQNKLITDLVSLVTPNNDDILVIVDNTTNPSLSVTKKITYANLKESLQDMIDLMVSGGTGIDATYDDAGNTLTVSVVADSTTQKGIISNSGTTVGTRQELNLIPGASIALSGVDNPTDNRVDLTIKNTGVSTATSLSASGSTYDVLSAVQTLGDGTQAVRMRTLKAGSSKVDIAFSDASNAVAIDVVPGQISINDLSITAPLALAQGGTASTTASGARANLGAAKAGVNSDITALSGMTTALSISQGGTAGTTAQDALQNLGGLKYVADVSTVGESIVVSQASLVSNEYRSELKGVRAGSNKVAISTISNDIAVDVNADNVLNAASNNVNFNAVRLTNVADPISSNDVASKSYVDSVAQGLQVKDAVVVATDASLTGSYSTSNQTFTLTATGTPSIDGVNVTALGTRVLFKDQSQGSDNGIYTLTTAAASGVSPVFTRADDFNTNAEVDAGAFAFVLSGTTNSGKQFVQTADNPTLDTTSLAFSILADSSINDDSVSNAKLENMDANRIKGAVTSGDPNDLSADQVITVLNTASSHTLNSARIASVLDSNARTAISVAGSAAGTRRKINFIAGSNVTISAVDDSANEEVDVTISSTAAGGGGVSLGLAVALG